MASTSSAKLPVLCAQCKDKDAIPLSSVFSPTSIFEPPSHFPATLLRNNVLANHVSDVLATKLAELAPASRKQTFLRDIGYVGCSTDSVAYLCKKDSPVLQPLEIRLESDIQLLETILYDWTTSNKTNRGTIFLALFTELEMHCYEARPIEHDEIDLVPSFTVDTPSGSLVTCVLSTKTRRVFCGTNKGEVCELRTDVRDRQPMWMGIGDSDSSDSPVSALRVDEGKGLVYALHGDSTVDVFLYRSKNPGEVARRIGGYRPDPKGHVSFIELFPMPSAEEDTAHLLGVSKDGVLFNFDMDLRPFRRPLSFVKKFLRPSSPTPLIPSLVHESTCLSTRLYSENEERRITDIGYYEGLVMAVPSSEDGNPTIELYSASRLPSSEDSGEKDPARVTFFKEPIRLDGTFISMHNASDDDNTRLFEGLDLGGDELSRQVFLKGNKFVILTENRVIDVRKRCPVEILMEILQEHDPERVDEFFRLYGPLETATMAVQLAAARGDDHARRLLLDDHRLSTMFFSTETHDPDELSIPTRAILSYFRRLTGPLWDRPLFRVPREGWRKGSAKMTSVLSTALLEWFAGSLEELGKFVEVYVEEFRAVRFFDGTVFAPKCPSILSEFELLFALKDLIIKCTEILNLVRIFEEARPVDVSERQMKTFTKKSFQSFVFMNETSTSPIQGLISSVLSGKDPEVQEAITFKMDNEIPHLCDTKEKVYRKALSLLKKAKTSPRLERQEILVSKAVNLLGDNCEERHIDAIISSLADLQRHYEVLQFVSKTAKKLVPEPTTSDVDVQKKAQLLRRRCYDRVFSYVADYIQNIDTDDDASLDIPVLYGAVQCLDDRHMMQMMMEKLLSSNKVPRRQLHQPSYTEFGVALKQYISQKVMNVSNLHEVKEQVGVPLSASAEQEVRLLVAICQSQEEMKQAGDWLMLLAKRESKHGQKIPLIERIGDLNDAKAMYKTVMPESFMTQIEKEIELAMFQQRVLTMGTRIFAIMNDVHDNGQDVKDVTTRLVGVDVLHRVIRDNFPDKTSQDLTEELQRIARDGFDIVSADETLTET